MQIVCEATQATDSDLQVSAFECLCRIMSLYYDHMGMYMPQALYGITILGMRHQNDRVALQAVEFWSTICEIELELALEAEEAVDLGEPFDKENHNFAQKACKDLLDPLLWLLTQKEDEEDEDEWSIAMASATCLASLANVVKDAIVGPVVGFIENRIRSDNWRDRDGAVMAFGSILDGPNPISLIPVIQGALPVLVGHMKDPSPHVKDSTAWTLGRISEILGASLTPEQLDALVAAVIPGLADTPRVAGNCAWVCELFTILLMHC